MSNGWGGRRAGAGRKSATTVERQAARRQTIDDRITAQDWDQIIDAAVTLAKQGDWRARDWVSAFLAGGKPRGEAELDISVNHQVVVWPTGWDPPVVDTPEPPRLIDGTARPS
jgi:hypothetical protein